MQSKILIVIGREYTTRVRKKSFIILTVLMPFLIAALVALPLLLGMIKDSEAKTVAVVDSTHRYESLFKDTPPYRFVVAARMDSTFRKEGSDVQAVVVISGDLARDPSAAAIYSREEVQIDLRHTVENILNEQIRRDKLAAYQVPELDAIISDVEQDFSIQTRKWSDDGTESESSIDLAMGLGLLFTMLIYMFVMSYGSMVMQGVMEEKTNRIMEVMVSSVRPFQLMMGKIIGVMLVGLTQIAIWGVMLVLIFAGVAFASGGSVADALGQAAGDPAAVVAGAAQGNPAAASSDAIVAAGATVVQNGGLAGNLLIDIPVGEIALMFVLCFLGGYLLYASIFAACGAAVNSQEDSSQFVMPLVIVMIFALYAALGSIENTNGPLAFWTSLIPFTSPIVMMLRVPFNIPLWQEVLSLGILFATDLLFVWIGARIYRVGILMYGKKPTMRELWKWLRFS